MTQTTQRSTVVGVFRDRDRAEQAVEELHRAGFRDDQIGFAAREGEAPTGSTEVGADTEHGEAGGGAAKGVVGGGVIGGVLGALATGLIPGIGPVIAGGLLAGIVGGAAIGAAGGGILGALVGGMGVPEDEARYYDQEFKSGRTVVTVKADGRYDEAQALLRQYDAYDVTSRGREGEAGTPATAAAEAESRETGGREARFGETGRVEDRERLQLREEELQTRKTSVERGQVSLGKEVVEEEKSVEVPVTREEVYVERRPVDRPADQPVGETAERTIEVPVREERVDVDKQPVVYEEAGVRKQEVVQNQPVSETVRREELRVGKEGDADVSGAGRAQTWDTAMPRYRQRWQQRSGTTGGRWEDAEPGYRYGWEMRNRAEYRGRPWTEVEGDFERDWTTRNPNRPWDRTRESVRDAWEGD